jgi:hypothetical protein
LASLSNVLRRSSTNEHVFREASERNLIRVVVLLSSPDYRYQVPGFRNMIPGSV